MNFRSTALTGLSLAVAAAPSASALELLSVTGKPGKPGDPGIVIFRSGDSGFDAPGDSFSGQIQIEATMEFNRFGAGESYTFLQLGEGAKPALAVGNGWKSRVWSVFHGKENKDIPIPGPIPVKAGEPRSFTITIDYSAERQDTATVTLSGGVEPLVLKGDFSFVSLLVRNGNAPAGSTASFTALSISGLPRTILSKAPRESAPLILTNEKLKRYVERFNADDEELHANIPNRDALAFLDRNIPLFECPDEDFEAGWAELTNPEGFHAPFGPTHAEQRHPGFKISYEGHECQWNGPSWPLATSEVLTACANLLNHYEQDAIGKEEYFERLEIYTKSHQRKREDGKVVPWIDETVPLRRLRDLHLLPAKLKTVDDRIHIMARAAVLSPLFQTKQPWHGRRHRSPSV